MRLLGSLKSSFVDLPTPINLSYFYGLGFLLGVVYLVQSVSGVLLSLFYSVGVFGGYESVVSIMQMVEGGWLVRFVHSGGASVMFLLVYLHIIRGVVFSGLKSRLVWLSGVVIMMVLMAVSFLGYVLPWGQMSYWGMTVVTSMLGAIPVVGEALVSWLWGGSVASVVSLVRFYSFHYLVSLIMGVFIVAHLLVLHEKGSSNPLGVFSSADKMVFYPLFVVKDLLGVMVLFVMYWFSVFVFAYSLMDETNFEEVNYLSTPSHIKPEWYFLYAYCILRSVESKLGGVILMLGAVGVLVVLGGVRFSSVGSACFNIVVKLGVLFLVVSFVILVYLGAQAVEYPFQVVSKVFTFMYFFSVIFISLLV
uniref:Cytochrome b n=1 Tax=Pallisentis celatus TaxID=935648 RepID=V5IXC5_PALCE|nr:cytochrome b [Pallisentis celatus]AFK50139.1 cytochrome b [Pallisentis celatus]